MVHHYIEKEEDADETSENTVKFNAKIEPPHVAEAAELPPPPPPPTPSPCCPVTTPDPMETTLPIIMVTIGVAYMIGFATGAVIFSSSE